MVSKNTKYPKHCSKRCHIDLAVKNMRDSKKRKFRTSVRKFAMARIFLVIFVLLEIWSNYWWPFDKGTDSTCYFLYHLFSVIFVCAFFFRIYYLRIMLNVIYILSSCLIIVGILWLKNCLMVFLYCLWWRFAIM